MQSSTQINILYLCYDGLNQPIGQSQVLQLLLQLSKNPHLKLTILSLESRKDLKHFRHLETKRILKNANIDWRYHQFHYKPKGIATLLNLIKMILTSIEIIHNKKIQIIHARAFFPAFISLIMKRLFKIVFVFDMRGFWPDEKADLNIISKSGIIYKFLKKIEALCIKNAAAVVSLTNNAIKEMKTWKNIQVEKKIFYKIPTNVDLTHFQWNKKNKSSTAPVIAHIGSAHSWYLMDSFFTCCKKMLQICPESKIKILNRHDHAYLKQLIKKHQIPKEKVEIKNIEHNKICAEMNSIDLAIFFIKPTYSKIASAPTKLAELLACGIPIITNKGIGDMDSILDDSRIGIFINDFSETSLEKACHDGLTLLNDHEVSKRAVDVAQKEFSMLNGAKLYTEIYQKIL